MTNKFFDRNWWKDFVDEAAEVWDRLDSLKTYAVR